MTNEQMLLRITTLAIPIPIVLTILQAKLAKRS